MANTNDPPNRTLPARSDIVQTLDSQQVKTTAQIHTRRTIHMYISVCVSLGLLLVGMNRMMIRMVSVWFMVVACLTHHVAMSQLIPIQGGLGSCPGMDELASYAYYDNCSDVDILLDSSATSGSGVGNAVNGKYFSFEGWRNSPATEACGPLLNVNDQLIISLTDANTVNIQIGAENITFPSFEQEIFPGVLFISYHRYYLKASVLTSNCSSWVTGTVAQAMPLVTITNVSATFSRFERVVFDYPRLPPSRISSQYCLTNEDVELQVEVNETVHLPGMNSSDNPGLLASLGGGNFSVGTPLSYCYPNQDDYAEDELTGTGDSDSSIASIVVRTTTCDQIPTEQTVLLCILEPPQILLHEVIVSPPVYSGENRTIRLIFGSVRYDQGVSLQSANTTQYGVLYPGACQGGALPDWETESPLTKPYYVCYRTMPSHIPLNVRSNDTFVFLADNATEITLVVPLRPHFQPLDDNYTLSENSTVSFTLNSTSWIQSTALFHYRITRLPTGGVVSSTPGGPSVRLGQLILNSTLYYDPDDYFEARDSGMQFIVESCGGITTDPATITFDVTSVFSGVIVTPAVELPLTLDDETGVLSVRLSDCVSLHDLDANIYNHTIHVFASKGVFESSDVCPSGCESFAYTGPVSNITAIAESTTLTIGNSLFVPVLDGIRVDVEDEQSVYCRFKALPSNTPTTTVTIDAPESPSGPSPHELTIIIVAYSAVGLSALLGLYYLASRSSYGRVARASKANTGGGESERLLQQQSVDNSSYAQDNRAYRRGFRGK
jgi:hypothetical protein